MQTSSHSQLKFKSAKNPSSSTDPYELHVPSGYSFYIVSSHPKFKPVLECYHGPNVVERFLRRLREEYQKIEQLLSHIEPMIRISKDRAASISYRADDNHCTARTGI